MMTRREIVMHNFRLYRPLYKGKTPAERAKMRAWQRLPFPLQAISIVLPGIIRMYREELERKPT